MNRQRTCALLATLVGLAACASTMQITAAWQRPAYQGPAFKKIAVVALSGNKETRRMVENFIAAELQERGIAGVAVNDVFAEPPGPEKADEIKQKLVSMGVDGAITVRLEGRSFKEHTVAPKAASERYAGNDFYGAYSFYYDPVYGDTTVELETTLVIEVALFGLDGKGAIAIRELTLKRTKLIEELEGSSSLLVGSLEEAGVLTGAKK
jgi:hypothetical protein